jgi:hypothetical protein
LFGKGTLVKRIPSLSNSSNSKTSLLTSPSSITFLYDKPSIDDVGVTERIERYVVGTAVDNYDGSLDVFDLLGTYQTDGTNMKVYYDGVLMDEGASNDYVETDEDTITFNYNLVATHIVTFRWLQYGVNALMVDEKRENHTATPAQTVFSLTYTYITNDINLKVYVGGILMRPGGIDYTETDSSTVTFTNPMIGGEYVTFTHAIAAAGNATTVNGIHATRNPEANKLYPLDSNAMFPAEVTGVSQEQTIKGWVNFDGTTNIGGLCTISDSYNVTSVTDNGTGNYTITWDTDFANANYVCVGNPTQANLVVSFASFATGSVVASVYFPHSTAPADDARINIIAIGDR